MNLHRPTVAVIVPWRDSGDFHRQGNMLTVMDHLTRWVGDELVLANDGRTQGPFNRSAAYNRGVLAAGDPDVFVFCEADMLIPFSQLDHAVMIAAASPGLVVPFSHYRYLDEESSRQVISGAHPHNFIPIWTQETATGAVNVVSAHSMEQIGCWDEAFEGHGYDDKAMEIAFRKATTAPTFKIPGPGYHLWHPMAFAPWEKQGPHAEEANYDPKEVAATRRNQERLSLYKDAVTPDQIRHLTKGNWSL